MKYKRVLIKISGEALQDKEQCRPHDPEMLGRVADQFRRMLEMGAQIAVVVGGGNIFRGLSGAAAGTDRTTGDYMGMLATVINALALRAALESVGVDARVMSAIPMPEVTEPCVARKAVRHLEKGRVVLYGAGTGNPFFTTDSAAALRAAEIGADVLMKATKVDGIYSADPMKDPNARRYERLTYREALEKRLQVMDMAAFSLCMENDIPIVVFNFFKENGMIEVLEGTDSGTLVTHE